MTTATMNWTERDNRNFRTMECAESVVRKAAESLGINLGLGLLYHITHRGIAGVATVAEILSYSDRKPQVMQDGNWRGLTQVEAAALQTAANSCRIDDAADRKRFARRMEIS